MLQIRHILFSFLLIIAVFAAYSCTWKTPFFFDDDGNIVYNEYIRIEKVSYDSLSYVWNAPHLNKNRKIAYLSFALNYLWGGYDVFSYHLVNIIIHSICGLLIALFFFQTLNTGWLKERYGASASGLSWGAALIWAIHPIQINAVTYIVQRMTSLAVLFSLLAMTAWMAGRKRWQNGHRYPAVLCWGLGIIAWIAGLMSKEHVVIVPLLILAHEFFLLRRGEFFKLKWQWAAISGIVVISLIFFYMGATPWKSILAGYAKRDFTLSERLLTQARVLWHYVSLFYIPIADRFSLLSEYPVSRGLFLPVSTAISLIAWIGVVIVSWLYRKRLPIFAWMIAWFLISHLVESTIIPLEIIFEHRMYLPSIGLALGTVLFISEISYIRQPAVQRALLFSILIILGAATYTRNMDFKDEVTLYRAELRKYPNSQKIQMNLALALNDAGNMSEGGKILEEMVKTYPDDIFILHSWYDFLIRIQNDAQGAEVVYRHIAELVGQDKYHPYKDAISLRMLADFFFRQGQYERTLFFVEKLLKTHRYRSALWLLDGLCYAKLQNWHRAKQSFEAAWKISSSDTSVLYWYGISLINTGEHDKGCKLIEKGSYNTIEHLPAQLSREALKEYCSGKE
jgi:tetratricopeptide (TPR) repeat protein